MSKPRARGKSDNILERKVHGPKMRVAGFPAMDSLCQTFASIAATRARADLRPGIEVTVYGFEVARHGDYLRSLYAPSAIYLLNFSAQGGSGFMKAHPRLLGKVLDIYLGGDGSFEESNFSRSLTAIDLSIYGRFVDLIARAFDEAIRELCGRSAIGVAKRARFEQQPGMVRIAHDQSEIFVIKLNFHINDDTRGAGLDFVVPISTLEPLKRDLTAAAANSAGEAAGGVWAGQMLNHVLDTPLKVLGAIDLGSFEVGELSRLEAGQLLEIPAGAVDRIALRVRTAQGPVTLATARLGARDRRKALKLNEDPSSDFLAPLRARLGL